MYFSRGDAIYFSDNRYIFVKATVIAKALSSPLPSELVKWTCSLILFSYTLGPTRQIPPTGLLSHRFDSCRPEEGTGKGWARPWSIWKNYYFQSQLYVILKLFAYFFTEKVAIKTCNKQTLTPRARKMLLREIAIMETIYHPNIVRWARE